ncbi:MAG: hypothetical protein IJQ87_00070 [Clostridia bacterium]|nr:hypothetical protein [Clostridia bacterium]
MVIYRTQQHAIAFCMDKAFLNNKIVSAYDISLNYEREKAVRKDSRNKKILCIDSDCKNPVLRYCHGDKKQAYFAHLSNTDCDYDRFDKNDNEIFKKLRITLSSHFSNLGYKVETEYKILDHHYSPIFCSKGSESFVVEMGNSKTTSGFVEKIKQEYSLKNISVKWLVVGEETLLLKENGVSFLKRYLLNESKNNDFILVDGNEIIQYRFDKNVYSLSNYQEIYNEKASIQDLCVIDGELSIKGYNNRYFLWQKQKEEKIAQELAIIERRKQEREMLSKLVKEKERMTQISDRQQIQNLVENKPVFDSKPKYEKKTYTCSQCGKEGGDGEFYFTQGNYGTCWECHYGKEKYEEIKKQRGW